MKGLFILQGTKNGQQTNEWISDYSTLKGLKRYFLTDNELSTWETLQVVWQTPDKDFNPINHLEKIK